MSIRLCLLLLSVSLGAAVRAADPTGETFFEARVRPLLVEHCWSCHGPEKQKGGVRLDERKHVLQEGDLGPIVVPGCPDKSVLMKVLSHQGDVKMPPKAKLPAAAIDTLTAWVKMGAPWPASRVSVKQPDAVKTHWAFRPIQAPPLPVNKDAAWARTSLDRFILAALEAKGLSPSPPVDRRTLLRRLWFDLVGLPPTPEELYAFENDDRPDAVERLVDRLLESPHHGERWGRHWLDIARYADTKGYVFFEEAAFPWAYTYRDYVIRSFNEDKPYDRFILEQLAADRLDLGPDREPLTAMGFLTAGGRFMNNVHDVLDDRIDVITRGLLGMTVTCARCHDHKYDPISMKDYYGLYGILGSSAEPTVPPLFREPPATEEFKKYDAELRAREKKLTDFVKLKHDQLVAGARQRVAEYLLAAEAIRDQPSTEEFMLLADTNDLNPTLISRWVKYLHKKARSHDPVFAPWFAIADAKSAMPPRSVDDVLAVLVAEGRPLNPRLMSALVDAKPKTLADVAQVYAKTLHAAAARRDSKATAEEELRQVFEAPDAPANVALLPYGDLSLLPDRASQATLRELRTALEKHRASAPGAPPRAMVLEDLPTPLESRVFLRGNPHNKGESAPRAVPTLWAESPPRIDAGSGRLELARSIASRDNPLTARVLVNRVWHLYFGVGLVRTPSDFGVRCEPPSHPELLDHLAHEFMANGWSLRKLHRTIVLSATYRQRSDHRTEAVAVDPENRLLWKSPRRRLDFEAMRDSLLTVADRLDRTIGGPSVANGLTAAGTRRTLYTHLDRLNVPGLLRTFDFPSPDATSPERALTTIPPQALFLMNHPLVMDASRRVASRPDFASVTDPGARVERIHRLIFSRGPTAAERDLALRFVAAEGNSAAAWQRYVHALVQTNEFVTLD